MGKLLIILCGTLSISAQTVVVKHKASAGITCASGYTHCAQLTIGSVTGTLTDFPVLVDLTLGTGTINSASCYDVAFSSTSSGTTPLYWETDFCASGSRHIIAHVRNTISTGTTFWVQWQGSQSTFQSTASTVWSASYAGVWHLANGTTLGNGTTTPDSTSGANELTLAGTSNPGAGSGKINGASTYTGATGKSYLYRTTAISPQPATSCTMCAWINTSSATQQMVVSLNRFVGAYVGEGFLEVTSDGKAAYTDYGADFGFNAVLSTASVTGAWTHLCFTKSGTAGAFYVNGAPDATHTAAINVNYSTGTGAVVIGADQRASTDYTTGSIDEVRISTIARPAAWIAAEYANQNAPGTFVTKGVEN